MSKKECTHKDFWEIYKLINFKKSVFSDNGKNFVCSKCAKNCTIKWKGSKQLNKNAVKRYFTYFLWMLPAIVLIYLSVTGIMSYWYSILAITVFHFAAMYYLINSDKLVIKCK